MDIDRVRLGGSTRRELIVGGLLTGSILSGTLLAAEQAGAQTEAQTEALRTVLDVELLLAFGYQRVMRSRLLSVSPERLAGVLLAHERAHVRLLGSLLSMLGSRRSTSPIDDHAAEQALARFHVAGSFADMHSEKDALRLMLGIEVAAEGVYYQGITKLSDPALVGAALEMMASEAQHATALSRLLDPRDIAKALPDAFVQGRPA